MRKGALGRRRMEANPDLHPTNPIRSESRSLTVVHLYPQTLKGEGPLLKPLGLGAIGSIESTFDLNPKPSDFRKVVDHERKGLLQVIEEGIVTVVLLQLATNVLGQEGRRPEEKGTGQDPKALFEVRPSPVGGESRSHHPLEEGRKDLLDRIQEIPKVKVHLRPIDLGQGSGESLLLEKSRGICSPQGEKREGDLGLTQSPFQGRSPHQETLALEEPLEKDLGGQILVEVVGVGSLGTPGGIPRALTSEPKANGLSFLTHGLGSYLVFPLWRARTRVGANSPSL
jgi:hypothetical protein